MSHEVTEVLVGVSEGFILSLQLSDIFVNDIFLLITNSNLCNYTDDNTLFEKPKCGKV